MTLTSASKVLVLDASYFQDGDVTVRSKDKVDFKIHRANLEFFTNRLPYYFNEDESLMEVSETASVLTILLLFLYPRQGIPDLSLLPFERLCTVAAAAKKWGLTYGLELCDSYLISYLATGINQHDVFITAGRRDSIRLFAAAASYALAIPFENLEYAGVTERRDPDDGFLLRQ